MTNRERNQRGYVLIGLQEGFVDSEDIWNDDTRNAHHCSSLEILNQDHQTKMLENFQVPLPTHPRNNHCSGFFIVLTNF